MVGQQAGLIEEIVEKVRAACINAALEGYEDASANGLCHEGAWECAVEAMRQVDLMALLPELDAHSGRGDQTSMR